MSTSIELTKEEYMEALQDKMAETLAKYLYLDTRSIYKSLFAAYLKDEHTNSFSEFLGDHTNDIIKGINCANLIQHMHFFCTELKEYAAAKDTLKSSTAQEIFSKFFGIAKTSATLMGLDPIIGRYMSMVIDIAQFALDKGIEMINAHNDRLNETIEECNKVLGQGKGFDIGVQESMNDDIKAIQTYTNMSNNEMIDVSGLVELLDYYESLEGSDIKYHLKVDGQSFSLSINWYNETLENFRDNTMPNVVDALYRNDGELSSDTVNSIQSIYDSFRMASDARFESMKDIILNSSVSTKNHSTRAGSVTYNVDPLVIDLEGNGFELTGLENGVYFDMTVFTLLWRL